MSIARSLSPRCVLFLRALRPTQKGMPAGYCPPELNLNLTVKPVDTKKADQSPMGIEAAKRKLGHIEAAHIR